MKGLLLRLITGGATTAAGAPIWLWLVGGLVLAAAGLGAAWRLQVAALHVDLANARTALAQEKTGRADDRAKVAQAAADKERTNGIETVRRLDRQAENDAAGAAKLARAMRDRDLAVAERSGLQLQLATYLQALGGDGRPGDPAAESQCAPARAAAGVLADLFRQADERAGILAEHADRARIAGLQCEADYDSLTLKPERTAP